MQDWIKRLVTEKYQTYGALAKAIGMTDSGFSRAAKAGTFDLENCLRLANETGESAATVLTMAGKVDANELIEKLYGRAKAARDPDAAKAHDLMAGVRDPKAREGFLMMLRGYLQAQDEATKAQSTTARLSPRPR